MKANAPAELERSTYDRNACQIGIVHLGYGAFHRAHQAVFVDRYMAETGDLSWGIAAVNLRASESASLECARQANDGYVLKTMSRHGDAKFSAIRSHVAFADWSSDAAAAEDLIAQPNVHLITMTVTESGYVQDKTGTLNLSHPLIGAELNGGARSTIYAYLTAALEKRRLAGGWPITIACCDNIRGNGRMLRTNLNIYLQALGKTDLMHWLETNATFPCSMVDRITPKPTAELSQEIGQKFGREGDQTVMAEAFCQWIIEDDFAGKRPALERVGVTLADDIDPYEEAKIRILNGGHTCLAYLGALAKLDTFDQAMSHPVLRDHFDRFQLEEVLPALSIDLPFDKTTYLETVAARFENANIGDTVERICADGFAKFIVFIKPTLTGCLASGIEPQRGLYSAASWFVFARRAARGQMVTPYNEPNMALLKPLLEDPAAFATSEQLWSDLPQRYPSFSSILMAQIERVETSWPA